MTPSTSYWNSPFLIASCIGATFFCFGSLFILGIFLGQQNHARDWRLETATVVRTVKLCQMSYQEPFNPFVRRRGSRRTYLEKIDCKDLTAYLMANRDRYSDLRGNELDYIDISYPAIADATSRMRLSRFSDKPLAVGATFQLRVHPKITSLIEKISTDRDFWSHASILTLTSLFVFIGSLLWLSSNETRTSAQPPNSR